MLSRAGWARRCRPGSEAVQCKAKGFGSTATKPQQGKPKKATKRVAKENTARRGRNEQALHPAVALQLDGLDSLHQQLASGVVPAHSNRPDPEILQQFVEQNHNRQRSSLVSSTVATQLLDMEQREYHREQLLGGPGIMTGAGAVDVPGVIDVEVEAAQDFSQSAAATSQDSSTTAQDGPLLDEAELASRIARLWDDVPDELRELMASTEEPGLDAAVAEAALAEGPPEWRAADVERQSSSDLSQGLGTTASSTPADLDALLAPLQAASGQAALESSTSAAAPAVSIDSNETETVDYSNIAEQFTNVKEAGMVATPESTTSEAEQEGSTEGAAGDQEGESSIGSARVKSLQKELATANMKVQFLLQQLRDSEEHAELLAHELKYMQRQQAAGTYPGGDQQDQQDQQDQHQHQHQQVLAELEVQVAQIANELLMVSLSTKNLETGERRQLRAIVNDLLALQFSTTRSE